MAVNIYTQISTRIIKEQALIIGPIAWDEARKVSGLTIADQTESGVTLIGNPRDVVNRLVAQYERLFGKVSSETCKDAVLDLLAELPNDQVPESLK